MQPFEVSYTMTGRNGKKVRNVIGVLCPTVIAQRMGLARPIFVSLGDIEVDWNAPQSDGYVAMFDTPNAGVTGAAPALSAQRPATEGSEVERRVGGAVLPAPTFELHGPDGKTWMLYEDGTSTGFPEGTVIVNRAKPQLDLLRGRIKEFEAALIADQQ